MTEPMNTNPNPIEDALGERAKAQFRQEAQRIQIPEDLEALNMRTEMQYKDEVPEEPMTEIPILNHKGETVNVPIAPFQPIAIEAKTPALIPDLLPVTTTSSPELQPPQINNIRDKIRNSVSEAKKDEIRNGMAHLSAEMSGNDKDFDAAKKYLFDNGFNESAVAMHITVICASPLVAPDTNSWMTPLRHKIPALVYETLKKPGYLEGIWPSLKIVMGSNSGNAAWTVGIAITLAFFDVIKMLPVLE